MVGKFKIHGRSSCKLEEVGTTKGDGWSKIKGSKHFWEIFSIKISLELPHKGWHVETDPSSEVYFSGLNDRLDQEGVQKHT
jgi:hypothetical protein